MKAMATALLATLACSTTATAGVAEDLRACSFVGADAARLACYDALAGRAARAAAAQGAPAAQAPAAPAAPPAHPVPPVAADDDFGKPPPPKKPAEQRPSISARVVGPLREWRKGTTIRLDNGQVWRSIGDEEGYYPNVPENPEVTIRESFFGAYWLEIKAIDRKIKVKRVS